MTPQEKKDMTITRKGLVINLPESVSIAVDRHRVNLSEIGVRSTKSELCARLVEIGLKHDKL